MNKLSYLLLITLLLITAFFLPQMNVAVLVVALLASFYSAKYAIISISLAWLLTSLNPGIFASSEITIFLKQGIYFSALAGVTWRWLENGDRGLFQKDILTLLLFTVYVIVTSLFVSYYPDVSILKVTLFTVGLLSVILCYRELTVEKWQDTEEWFISLFLVITIFSFPLIFLPEGYTRNNRGFQGILNHPQVLGTFFAVVTAYSAGRMFQFKHYKWEYVFLTLLGVAYIFLSQSRTGLLGLLLSFGLAVVITFRRSVKDLFLIKKFIIPLTVLVILLIPYYGQIGAAVSDFLLKSEKFQQVDVALEQSRGAFFYASLQNFMVNPVWGNGFGIASNPIDMIIQYDPIFNIPMSASVEKGIAPMALLEENGIIGSFIFIVFLFFLCRRLLRRRELYLAWPILAVFAINLGEATIFSFNAHAGLYWLIIMHHLKELNSRD